MTGHLDRARATLKRFDALAGKGDEPRWIEAYRADAHKAIDEAADPGYGREDPDTRGSDIGEP
jgi:hypothetical protein